MVLEEALRTADEAEKEGYLNRYPQATIALAKEVRRLKARRKKATGTIIRLNETKEEKDVWQTSKEGV